MRYIDKTGTDTLIDTLRHPREEIADGRFLLARIGRLWINGTAVDWRATYDKETPRRIPLPAYPFERRRYWDMADALALPGAAAEPGLVSKARRDMADWFYVPVWEQAPLAALFGDETGETESRAWLIFLDDRGIGQGLARELKRDNPRRPVVTIKKGSRFQRLETGCYMINPGQPGDYDALLRSLREDEQTPARIIHAWGVTGHEPAAGENPLEHFGQTREHLLYSLLYMVQAIGGQNITAPLYLTVITDNMQEVTGGEALCPGKAVALGAIKSIPLEYPNIRCRGIDIQVQEVQEERLLKELYRELQDFQKRGQAKKDPYDVEIAALRGSYRWKQTFRPLRLEKPAAPAARIKENGVYLITGGFGGMGFTLAQDLAKHFRARLILVGRSAFPARDQWDRWLEEHGEDHDTSRKIERLRQMERWGAEVMIAHADVSNLEQMRAVISGAQERFGGIDGVLHTAAIIDYGGIIQRRARESIEAVLAPKTGGLLVLETLLDHEKLDFFAIFSSIASVLTPFGQVGYTAANAVLDAFVFARRRSNRHYTVIDWSDWLEVGMAVKAITRANEGDPERARAELERMEAISLTPSEGVAVFQRILAHGQPRVVVCIQDLETMTRFHRRFNTDRSPGIGRSSAKNDAATVHQRPVLSSEYRAPAGELEKTIAHILQQFLAIDKVGIDDNFFELGLTSLDIIQVNARLSEELNRDIPLVTMFSYPTIRHFTAYIGMNEEDDDAAAETAAQAGELLQQSIDLLRE
jgi:NAD(P)-dependent dehydrogenase (short-subunit alcohol dehydrogenase family)/acyl carrier protein